MDALRGKWENLPKDCLVIIFGGVGIESLLYDVPFVCKSWYHASLDPFCWQILDFTQIKRPHFMNICWFRQRIDIFIKSVVDRSRKLATKVVLPRNHDFRQVKALECISNECPDLKILHVLSYIDEDELKLLSELIVKWKSLEILLVSDCSLAVEILTQIQLHCKSFVGFFCEGGYIKHELALAMIGIPGMKYLQIKGCFIGRDVLEMIIKNCKNLELLNASECMGFDEEDSDLRNLASHIKSFLCQGSICYEDENGIDDYGYDYDIWLR